MWLWSDKFRIDLLSIGKFNDTVTLNGIVLNSGAVADVFIAKT